MLQIFYDYGVIEEVELFYGTSYYICVKVQILLLNP